MAVHRLLLIEQQPDGALIRIARLGESRGNLFELIVERPPVNPLGSAMAIQNVDAFYMALIDTRGD